MKTAKSVAFWLAAALAVLAAGCAGERTKETPPLATDAEVQAAAAGESVADTLPGTVFDGIPLDAELLDDAGEFALFRGHTPEDAASNAAERETDPEVPLLRNSLFLLRRAADGGEEWRLVLTSGSDWRVPDGTEADDWRYRELGERFAVLEARFASDKRHLWLVCDPHSFTFFLICSYDCADNVFRVIGDGSHVDEEPDGTIRLKNRKTYLSDENGAPLGAAWYDEWIAPDGTSVRKTEPTQNPPEW